MKLNFSPLKQAIYLPANILELHQEMSTAVIFEITEFNDNNKINNLIYTREFQGQRHA